MAETVRTTYKEQLRPTLARGPRTGVRSEEPPRALPRSARTAHLPVEAARRLGASLPQEAEEKMLRIELSEYAALHSHVLQEALACLDTTYRGFCCWVAADEKPEFPLFQACTRCHSLWRHYLSLLASRAAGAGKQVEALTSAHISQECCGCGARIQQSLERAPAGRYALWHAAGPR